MKMKRDPHEWGGSFQHGVAIKSKNEPGWSHPELHYSTHISVYVYEVEMLLR